MILQTAFCLPVPPSHPPFCHILEMQIFCKGFVIFCKILNFSKCAPLYAASVSFQFSSPIPEAGSWLCTAAIWRKNLSTTSVMISEQTYPILFLEAIINCLCRVRRFVCGQAKMTNRKKSIKICVQCPSYIPTFILLLTYSRAPARSHKNNFHYY